MFDRCSRITLVRAWSVPGSSGVRTISARRSSRWVISLMSASQMSGWLALTGGSRYGPTGVWDRAHAAGGPARGCPFREAKGGIVTRCDGDAPRATHQAGRPARFLLGPRFVDVEDAGHLVPPQSNCSYPNLS